MQNPKLVNSFRGLSVHTDRQIDGHMPYGLIDSANDPNEELYFTGSEALPSTC